MECIKKLGIIMIVIVIIMGMFLLFVSVYVIVKLVIFDIGFWEIYMIKVLVEKNIVIIKVILKILFGVEF